MRRKTDISNDVTEYEIPKNHLSRNRLCVSLRNTRKTVRQTFNKSTRSHRSKMKIVPNIAAKIVLMN